MHSLLKEIIFSLFSFIDLFKKRSRNHFFLFIYYCSFSSSRSSTWRTRVNNLLESFTVGAARLFPSATVGFRRREASMVWAWVSILQTPSIHSFLSPPLPLLHKEGRCDSTQQILVNRGRTLTAELRIEFTPFRLRFLCRGGDMGEGGVAPLWWRWWRWSNWWSPLMHQGDSKQRS